MHVPETPQNVKDLDLMIRLDAYAQGKATWFADGSPVGSELQRWCRSLHTHLTELIEQVFAFLLDRVNAREMDIFTMHDRRHGQKVAHLMWHIVAPERRSLLSPPEIALMIFSAYLHDAGMALTRAEREERLAVDSDLWLNLESSDQTKQAFLTLQAKAGDTTIAESQRKRAELELQQAEEALLTTDTRLRHATPARYKQLLGLLAEFHRKDQIGIPDIERCMSFGGDSFKTKLVEICVSHNEGAEALVERDRENFQLRRFPRVYPVGGANADLQLVAAALRLADILDFDRERTPALLFHYLLPGSLSVGENISRLEWSKHLAISNWEITKSEVVFRGRCTSHIVHHAIVQFCKQIAEEISSTHASFTALEEQGVWPFVLPKTVKPEIHEDGYHYVPYSFELDDARIYQLLMGGSIYDNPLVAMRELIQNAVDACKLRDALMELHDPSVTPATKDRITVRYEEPLDEGSGPRVTVQDTGTGMDAWLIERWFLQVGRSYYSSSDFNKTRVSLRMQGLDFAPVSEFGIGFLSCFLLANRVEVETAMWEPIREDTRKRHLTIDGPTRLIRVREDANGGPGRFKGTKVTLHLCRGAKHQNQSAPSWNEIREYIAWCCEELPYTLRLEYVKGSQRASETLSPRFEIRLPSEMAPHSVRIPVDDQASGLEGEIILVSGRYIREAQEAQRERGPLKISPEKESKEDSVLLRGGFRIGEVPGLPEGFGSRDTRLARIRERWQKSGNLRYGPVNLARNAVTQNEQLSNEVIRIWLSYLIRNRSDLPEGMLDYVTFVQTRQLKLGFLESFSAYEVYELARQGWASEDVLKEWEAGEGPPLRLGQGWQPSGVWRVLLDLVLPRAVRKTFVSERLGLCVYPPDPGWREALSSWRDFITNPKQYPLFAEYEAGIAGFLFEIGLDRRGLNSRFAARFAGVSESEGSALYELLANVARAKGHGFQLLVSPHQIALLRRHYYRVSDLDIKFFDNVLKIRDIGIETLPEGAGEGTQTASESAAGHDEAGAGGALTS